MGSCRLHSFSKPGDNMASASTAETLWAPLAPDHKADKPDITHHNLFHFHFKLIWFVSFSPNCFQFSFPTAWTTLSHPSNFEHFLLVSKFWFEGTFPSNSLSQCADTNTLTSSWLCTESKQAMHRWPYSGKKGFAIQRYVHLST